MPMQPTPEARSDYNALLESLMPFAQTMLKKHGEFFPFGAAINTAGEVTGHMTYDGNEKPDSDTVIAALVQAFQTEAREGKIRASGICYDACIDQDGKKVDAVVISLEHACGSATKTCVPYGKGLFGGIKLGQLIAAFEQPRVFVSA